MGAEEPPASPVHPLPVPVVLPVTLPCVMVSVTPAERRRLGRLSYTRAAPHYQTGA